MFTPPTQCMRTVSRRPKCDLPCRIARIITAFIPTSIFCLAFCRRTPQSTIVISVHPKIVDYAPACAASLCLTSILSASARLVAFSCSEGARSHSAALITLDFRTRLAHSAFRLVAKETSFVHLQAPHTDTHDQAHTCVCEPCVVVPSKVHTSEGHIHFHTHTHTAA